MVTTRLRHAARRLLRAPVFACSTALTLTLGIGATAAVFTVVNGVLLRPLPFAHADQLVDLSHSLTISGISRVDQSDATYLVYRRDNRVFTDVGAYRETSVNLRTGRGSEAGSVAASERVSAAFATATVFRILGVWPSLGRGLGDDDGKPGAAPVVVIGHGLWQRALGADPAVVGKRIVIDGIEREVVGVFPRAFGFPAAETALWLPLPIDPAHTQSAAFDYRGIGRLKEGVSLTKATADLQRLLPLVPEFFPGRLTTNAIATIRMQAVVRPLKDAIVGDVSRLLWVVLSAVVALLLLACANVTNLFLARAEGRQRELAIRRALGAGRGAQLAEFLSEAAIVATVGGTLGILLVRPGVQLLRAARMGASVPRLAEVQVDGLTVVVTALLAAIATLIVSIVPFLRAERVALSATLSANTPSASGGVTRSRARRTLVAAQVAIALVLLAGAGLLARSAVRLRSVDPGFDARQAVTFRLALPNATYPAAGDAARLIANVLDAITALPGVQAAGVITKIPLDEESRQDSAVFVEDRPARAGQMVNIHPMVFVTPAYFRAMGIPLVAGRLFARLDPGADPALLPREVIVSKAFGDRYWKGEQPVGRRIRMSPGDPWSTIVGVVGSVHEESLERSPGESVYSPMLVTTTAGAPWTPHNIAFVVRAAGDPAVLAAPIDRVVRDVAPALPLYRAMPLSDLLSHALARTTFTLLLVGVAAVVATIMGAMGIYGVISYMVSLRAREMSVRRALGATPSDVLRLVTRHTLTDTLIGIGVGLAGAGVLTRALAPVLFNVNPLDPVALGGAAALLLLTALAASWIPARRAAALDPANALRPE